MVTLKFDYRLLRLPLPDDTPKEYINRHTITLKVPSGKSVNQILIDLDIQLSQAVSAVINGQSADLEQPLESGDIVRLLPQIAGGD